MVKQLLVDLDGTLLGNSSLWLSVDFVRRAVGVLRKHGGSRKAVSTLLAIQNEFKKTSLNLTNDIRVIRLFAERMELTEDEARLVIREGLSSIFPQLKKHFFPVKGSKEFLDWAKERYPMILATNPVWPPEIQELRVQWAGIDPKIFGSITHARRMKACKPSAQYYREILEQENLRAEDCLLIGDDMKMDLPATEVGIRVFIVGKFRKTEALKRPNGAASAWKGSYAGLRSMLESEDSSNITKQKGR